MIDQKHFINQFKELKEKLSWKGCSSQELEQIAELIKKKNEKISEVEGLKAQKNKLSKQIQDLVAKKGKDKLAKIQQESAGIKSGLQQLEKELVEQEQVLRSHLLKIPNLPHDQAPKGKSAKDNVEISKSISEEQLKDTEPHYTIAEKLDLLDTARASKLSGSLFAVLKGQGARLLRSLVHLAQELYQEDYVDFVVPTLVNSKTFTSTGHLPKFSEEAYHIEKDDLWLIPTGEVPLTAMHQGEILEELPLKYMTYTSCFRREAGAHGKETRGLGRLHEFHKVELVKICKPEEGDKELDKLLEDALKPIKLLGLPYRVLNLCTADLTFASARTYDIEVYSPGTQRWLEVSSVGLFTDFQMRRAGIRYRDGKQLRFPYALNGSGLATPRVLACLIEHNYRDGVLHIPKPLQKFMNCTHIEAK